MTKDPTDITDQWMRLRHPEKYELDHETAQDLKRFFREHMERTGIAEEARRSRRDEKDIADERLTAAMAEVVRRADTGGVCDMLRVSPEELVALVRQKRKRRLAAKTRSPHVEKALEVTLQAFLEVDKEFGSHDEAVRRALFATEALQHPPSEKTIRIWLSDIAGTRWSNIPAPKRGRPKKHT